MRGPDEKFSLDKQSRDERARQRDDRIKKKIAEKEAQRLAELAAADTNENKN